MPVLLVLKMIRKIKIPKYLFNRVMLRKELNLKMCQLKECELTKINTMMTNNNIMKKNLKSIIVMMMKTIKIV